MIIQAKIKTTKFIFGHKKVSVLKRLNYKRDDSKKNCGNC